MSEVFELLPAYKSAQHRYAGKIASVERRESEILVTMEEPYRSAGARSFIPMTFLVKPYETTRTDVDSVVAISIPVPENPFAVFNFHANLLFREKQEPLAEGEVGLKHSFECEDVTFQGRCALVEGYYAVIYKNEDGNHHFSSCPADVFEKANAPFTSTAEYNEQVFADKLVENMEVLNNAHNALKDVTRLLTEQGYTLAAVQASRDVAYANAVQLAKNYGYGDAAIAEMSNVGGGYLGELLKHLSGAKDKINPIDRPETQDIVLKAVNAYLSDEALGADITNSDKDKIRKTVMTVLHKELSRRS